MTSMIGGSQEGDRDPPSPSPKRGGARGEKNKFERPEANLVSQLFELTRQGYKHRLDQTSIRRTGAEPARKFELG